MSNLTLQAELAQIILHYRAMIADLVEDRHNHGIKTEELIAVDDQALKAILATVSKHLPKKSGKESEIKNIYGNPLGERIDMRKFKTGGTTDYINGCNSGYNTAITEMEKRLGGKDE